MTPRDFSVGIAKHWLTLDFLSGGGVGSDRNVRPVINVTSVNGFASGDGTSENPYIIQAE